VSTEPSNEWALAEHALAAEEARSAVREPVLAAERVILSLRDRLVLWFGPDGFQALLGRALHRAQVQHPVLGVVRALEGDDHPLYELQQSESHAGPASRDAVLALIVAMFEVLTRLVGGDLVTRLVHQIWPDGADAGDAATETRTPIRE
jgi:hypothetical protein